MKGKTPGSHQKAEAPSQLLRNLAVFVRALRGLGLDNPPSRTLLLARALDFVDLGSRRDVEAAARAVLVHRRQHLKLFERAFELFWNSLEGEGHGLDQLADLGQLLPPTPVPPSRPVQAALPTSETAEPQLELERPYVERRQTWSAREALRRKDFAALTAEEAEAVRQLMRREVLSLPLRRTRRRVSAAAGRLPDLRRTLRRSLRHGGEVLLFARRDRKRRRRPLVVLCDVSGSMEAYSRMLLQFLYTLRTASDRVEVFLFATRLTRVTRPLRHRRVDEALARATAAVQDFGGGTRIGECLETFNHRWGRRVLGQGAVVLLISDGWDRGEPAQLAAQMSRLQASCHRLLWLNPLLGMEGYEPLTRGLVAALPHVDDFRPVHNLESLAQLRAALA